MAEKLSEEQRVLLRHELERMLTRLEKSMKVTRDALRPATLDQTSVGRLSRIDTLQNQGLTRNLQAREEQKLGAILGALRRMESGEYGCCIDCGQPIAFERLMIFPESPSCQGCGPGV